MGKQVRRGRLARWCSLLLLMAALTAALAACGGRAAHTASGNGGYSTQSSSTSTGANTASGQSGLSSQGTSPASGTPSQNVQDTDQAVQNALGVLDNAQNDANTDYSAQDNETQP